MKTYRLLYVAAVLSALACSDREATAPPSAPPPPPPPPPPAALLKDVVIPNLPSPYYHFEYNTEGRVNAASFASGFFIYDVLYEAGRISEMRNNIFVNHDRLTYSYDNAGRVIAVNYVDGDDDVVFTRLALSYIGEKLMEVERQRRLNGVFVTDKTMSFSYYADGNLMELTEHRPALAGQPETTMIDRYELYDDKINVDGFSLIHDEFFDHLVLLPGVQLQKGNPARQTHTGDGLNYRVDYTYGYDDQKRPLTKSGDLVYLNGPDAGRRFQTSSVFTYY